MSEKSEGRGGALVAGLALAVCCGLPLIIASGALAVAGGWLARAWPLVVVGMLVLVYAAARVRRRMRERALSQTAPPDESRRR